MWIPLKASVKGEVKVFSINQNKRIAGWMGQETRISKLRWLQGLGGEGGRAGEEDLGGGAELQDSSKVSWVSFLWNLDF